MRGRWRLGGPQRQVLHAESMTHGEGVRSEGVGVQGAQAEVGVPGGGSEP